MIFLSDQGVIDILKGIFIPLWNGLDSVNVPGFDFSFADVWIAIMTAGFVGMLMKHLFGLFESHFNHELQEHKRAARERKAAGSGKDK